MMNSQGHRRGNGPLQATLLGISLSLASLPALAQEDRYDCVLEAKSTIELQSSEDGILDRILVSRGDRVTAGQVVAELDSEQQAFTAERARIRAEADTGVLSARAQAEYRRREAERLRDLRESDSVPERELAAAEVESELADIQLVTSQMEHDIARVEYQQANDLLARRSIKSPVDGVIVEVDMAPGEFVHEQAEVMTIAELNPLYVEMFMPVAEYGTVQPGMAAQVEPEQPIGGVYDAQVAVVDNVFDAASRTFRVRLLLPNEDFALPAGLRCSVRFLN